MLTLILDSGGRQVSVVLANDNRQLGAISLIGRPLAIMHTAMESLLEDNSISLQDIARVAVVVGPGLWTGLHIALATAKTICYVEGKPLIPLSRLDAIAETVRNHEGRIVVLLAASREKFIVAEYESANGELIALEQAKKYDVAELSEALSKAGSRPLLAGEIDDHLIQDVTKRTGRTYITAPMSGPSPEALVRLALATGVASIQGQALLDLEPTYMQGPDDMPAAFTRDKR